MKETLPTLPWVTFLEGCHDVQTETLKTFTERHINSLLKLGTNDAIMNEMYMALSYLLLERLGEEG